MNILCTISWMSKSRSTTFRVYSQYLLPSLCAWLIGSQAFAVDFSLMSFNTMCDFCHKVDADVFSTRRNYVQSIVEEYQADIIALQEVRSGEQVKYLTQNLKNYQLLYTDSALISYADPAIAINKSKFEVLDHGQFWLGPKSGDFSLGWKFALPRQALWVKLKALADAKTFIFISSHFDNRIENLLGAAKMVQDFISKQNLPVLFAGDTNLVPEYQGYKILMGENLANAFDQKESFAIKGEAKKDEDLCYYRKGDEFPACRVDHVLFTKAHDWKVKEWAIDTKKFGPQDRFPSDHRAVINQLSLD